MKPPEEKARRPVVFLFTTFPVLSETFLQREVSAMAGNALPMELVSLWGGEGAFEGNPVRSHGLSFALLSLFWIPYWLIRKPRATLGLIKLLWRSRRSGLLNWGENLLGAGYALRTANFWQRRQAGHFHAVWASAPAMAAHALNRLTGISFSFAAHAYDLFEHGGDGWLTEKLAGADFVRTSSQAGQERLISRGANPDKVLLVRRGLPRLPPFQEDKALSDPLRLLSVGRMVEKMGFDRQVPLLKDLQRKGLAFTMTWIGAGPERPALEKAIREAGLEDAVLLMGRCPYSDVEQAYASHDCFVFTGRIDRHGDRAGLPNALAEAMAWGLPVFATRVGATPEAVTDRQTGFLWEGDPDARDIVYALHNPELRERCRIHAREWIEENFDLHRNLGPLIAKFKSVTLSESVG